MMAGGMRYLALIMLLCMSMPPSASRMGYDVIASTNGQTLIVHRTTDYLNFSMDSSVKGTGNFSKMSHINKFAGIETKEQSSSAKEGDLEYDQSIRLLTRYGPVYAIVNLESINLTNGTVGPIILEGSADVVLDEAWPTYLSDHKKISYLGPGLISLEKYENNGDIISKYLDSWKLTKESLYQTFINRSIISFNMSSAGIRANWDANKTSLYQLSQSSTGSATRITAAQRSLNGDIARISEDYVGSQDINLRVAMTDNIIKNVSDDYWLDCCSNNIDYLSEASIKKFFDTKRSIPYDVHSI